MFNETPSKSEVSNWQSLKSVVLKFLGNHQCTEYEKEIKELLRVSTNLGYECQPDYTFCSHTWTIFQKNMDIWVNNWVSSFNKTFALWKSTTKAFKILIYSLTTAGAWNGMQWLPSIEKILERTLHPWIASFLYSSVYHVTTFIFFQNNSSCFVLPNC